MQAVQPAACKAAPAAARRVSPATAGRPAPAAARSVATAADYSAEADSVRSCERKSGGKPLGIGPDMTILIGAAAPTDTCRTYAVIQDELYTH